MRRPVITKAKICGLTNERDARFAAECGANYAGFVLYEKSPRHVPPARLAALTRALPATVIKVGVFVNASIEFVRDALENGGLDIAQLHGDESAEFAEMLGPDRVWKAFGLTSKEDVERACAFPAAAVLVDAVAGTERGGTGRQADWVLAAALAAQRATVLAGGLHPGNVAEAIQTVRPFAVDVSSGVEASKGQKDHERVRQFLAAVRKITNHKSEIQGTEP